MSIWRVHTKLHSQSDNHLQPTSWSNYAEHVEYLVNVLMITSQTRQYKVCENSDINVMSFLKYFSFKWQDQNLLVWQSLTDQEWLYLTFKLWMLWRVFLSFCKSNNEKCTSKWHYLNLSCSTLQVTEMVI